MHLNYDKTEMQACIDAQKSKKSAYFLKEEWKQYLYTLRKQFICNNYGDR